MNEHREEGEPRPTPGSSPRTAGPDYQSVSPRPAADSDGYQIGSAEPPTSAEVPESASSEPEEDDGAMDPFRAFAESAAKARERKKRERDPGTWLPGPDDLDQELGSPDGETRFSGDSYRGRGNPQVSVRLRPSDFERLRRAAALYGVRPTTLARMMVIRGVKAILDADLRRSGEFLRDRDRY